MEFNVINEESSGFFFFFENLNFTSSKKLKTVRRACHTKMKWLIAKVNCKIHFSNQIKENPTQKTRKKILPCKIADKCKIQYSHPELIIIREFMKKNYDKNINCQTCIIILRSTEITRAQYRMCF